MILRIELDVDTDDQKAGQAILDNLVESIDYYDPSDFGVKTMVIHKAEIAS